MSENKMTSSKLKSLEETTVRKILVNGKMVAFIGTDSDMLNNRLLLEGTRNGIWLTVHPHDNFKVNTHESREIAIEFLKALHHIK